MSWRSCIYTWTFMHLLLPGLKKWKEQQQVCEHECGEVPSKDRTTDSFQARILRSTHKSTVWTQGRCYPHNATTKIEMTLNESAKNPHRTLRPRGNHTRRPLNPNQQPINPDAMGPWIIPESHNPIFRRRCRFPITSPDLHSSPRNHYNDLLQSSHRMQYMIRWDSAEWHRSTLVPQTCSPSPRAPASSTVVIQVLIHRRLIHRSNRSNPVPGRAKFCALPCQRAPYKRS